MPTVRTARRTLITSRRDGGGGVSVPGPQVKNWPQYEALRAKGMTKTKAAKITNASSKKKKRRKKKRSG